MFTIAVNGSYPRDPDPPRPLILKQALAEFAAGRLTDRELLRARQRATVEIVAELIAAGVEIVSDGQVWSEDPIRELFSSIGGFDCTGERPRAVEPVNWRRPLYLDYYRFVAERSPVDVRPALPGPFSLARQCHPGIYGDDLGRLAIDLARALNRELEGLAAAGAEFILIEEPLLVTAKETVAQFSAAAQALCAGVEASLMLGTSGGDIIGIEEEVAASPFQGIALDLVAGPDNDLLLDNDRLWRGKIIQLGLVDAGSDEVEGAEAIALNLVRYAAAHDPGLLWVAPSAGMAGLPRGAAFEKLQSLYRGALTARRELARMETPGGV